MFRFIRYKEDDEYYTPSGAWEQIAKYIPRGSIVWEPFKGDGTSAAALRQLGFDVVCDDENFFDSALKGGIVVTNPPFSQVKKILPRLKELGVPFILLMPSHKLFTTYLREAFDGDDDFGVIVPRARIHFNKPGLKRSRCPFDCLYFTWKVKGLNGVNFA